MKTKKDEIMRQIELLQNELNGLAPVDSMTADELAEASGVSATTARRVKANDYNLRADTIRKLIPYMATCPCCDQALGHSTKPGAKPEPCAEPRHDVNGGGSWRDL